MAGEKVIVLSSPVEFGADVVSKLTMRRPKGRDLRTISLNRFAEMTIGELLDLGGRLVGRPPEFMDLLDGQDVLKIATEVVDFLSGLVAAPSSTT
jgi:hypothetical protein